MCSQEGRRWLIIQLIKLLATMGHVSHLLTTGPIDEYCGLDVRPEITFTIMAVPNRPLQMIKLGIWLVVRSISQCEG
ncbi:hypothetical protein K0M31_002359 [Melipona bicolor]|uniref:Uncharacterized protein n=1 Tax=Melipona bicolor TaxID=60889 RepID=A0AA40GHE0_9HYME|nr:hypothetical protein K0M31_002359 [Melipona bicolor]